MTEKEIKQELFICQCFSMEHQIIISKDEEETYLHVHLITHNNFFKRVIVGIKYMFGHRTRFGEFDEFILKEEDRNKLIDILTTKKI